jgi:hypothetical protein
MELRDERWERERERGRWHRVEEERKVEMAK